jgi:putative transposase
MMGSLEFGKNLSYRFLEGSCTKEVVIAYLQTLADEARTLNVFTIVVLDNASFHRAKAVKQHLSDWALSNLSLLFLPPYSPQLNLIESVWRNLKRFLSPRRAYPSTADLRKAILEALSVLGACQI